MDLPAHPGTVSFSNAFANTTEERDAADMEVSHKFCCLRDGVETDPDDADEIIPIVRVQMMSFDGKGELVDPRDAERILIVEYGPEDRVLRRTEMAT